MPDVTGFLFVVAMVAVPSYSTLIHKYYKRVDTCLNLTNSYVAIEATSRSECAVGCANDDKCESFGVGASTFTKTCYRYARALEEDGCVQNGFTHFTSNQVVEAVVCENGGMYEVESNSCSCDNSYTGDRCERLLEDCYDGIESGHYPEMDGVYTIQPALATQPFQVHCVMDELRILDRQRSPMVVNFTRGWADYRNGIGNVSTKDFWLGLEKLHLITNSRPGDFDLVVRATFNNAPQTEEEALYHGFKVSGESEGYSFSVDEQNPENTLSDCLGSLENQPFTTIDVDNDHGNCAVAHQSGWWFNNCSTCNPTGRFQPSSEVFADPNPHFLKWENSGGYAVSRLQMVLVYHAE